MRGPLSTPSFRTCFHGFIYDTADLDSSRLHLRWAVHPGAVARGSFVYRGGPLAEMEKEMRSTGRNGGGSAPGVRGGEERRWRPSRPLGGGGVGGCPSARGSCRFRAGQLQSPYLASGTTKPSRALPASAAFRAPFPVAGALSELTSTAFALKPWTGPPLVATGSEWRNRWLATSRTPPGCE